MGYNTVFNRQLCFIIEDIATLTIGPILGKGDRVERGAAAIIKTPAIVAGMVLAKGVIDQREVAAQVVKTCAGARLIVIDRAATHRHQAAVKEGAAIARGLIAAQARVIDVDTGANPFIEDAGAAGGAIRQDQAVCDGQTG